MHKKHIEYNYKNFLERTLPRMKHEHLVTMIENFVYKYNSNRDLVHSVLGESYCNSLIQMRLPKIIEHNLWRTEKYQFDVWHTYIVANWPQNRLFDVKVTSAGRLTWNAEWEDKHARHFNSHCYLGEY